MGLSLVPLMPLLDKPIERLLDEIFHLCWRIPHTHERDTLTDYEVATLGELELGSNANDAHHELPVSPAKPCENHDNFEIVRGRGDPDMLRHGG